MIESAKKDVYMPEINIIVPGRHHLTTTYWGHYIGKVLAKDLCDTLSVEGTPLKFAPGLKAKNLIFPITSANHKGTSRNPLDISKRTMLLDRFGQTLDRNTFQYSIDDITHSDNFASYIIEKIGIESQGRFRLSPENTIALTSTPELIKQFQKLWYQILPAELKPWTLENPEYLAERPWELLEYLAELARAKDGSYRNVDDKVLDKITKETIKLYENYQLVPYIRNLFDDDLLGSDGDLTETRDYREYLKSFDNGAERKYQQIKDYLRPEDEKIVDIGCCNGALIEEMTKNPMLQNTKFYGIEAARTLFDECVKRKESWQYFKSDYVFFLQENVVKDQSFEENSIDAFTSFSLTHEVYSYQSKEALEKMIKLITTQLKPGGRRINVDVIGPENGDRTILANFSKTDGASERYPEPSQELRKEDYEQYKTELRNFLESLSTHERFLRFAQDFRKEEGDQISYTIVQKDGEEYIQAPYKSICEFLSKKEYTLNRESEMHERFCDFAYSDWEKMLKENWLTLQAGSGAYTNDWIVENRRKGKVELFDEGEEWELLPIVDTPTNVMLIAEKGLA